MKNTILSLLLFTAILFRPEMIRANGTTSFRESVLPVSPGIWERRQPGSEFAGEMRYMLRQNNKYTLNKWFYEIKRFHEQSGRYLDFGGKTEHFIRPASHHAFTLALCLKARVYDAQVTSVPEEKAQEVTLRLIRSLAGRHKSNSGEDGWGDQWQSALWAAQAACAAWLMWDKLPATDRELVCRMLLHEADRFLGYEVPYYRDRAGNILSEGDTKAEENAWNSNILTMATAMMPAHPHAARWMEKNIELQLSAYATPADLRRKEEIDGVRPDKLLKGSNMNPDGTVVNHRIIHPDYMVAFMQNATNVWIYELAGKPALESSLHNGELIYHTLTERLFNGKTMYRKTAGGQASPVLYFPEGNDWGGKRQANYWLMDILAHLYGWDRDLPVKALDWAKARNKEMLYMLSRDTTGQYYQDIKEDRFPSREEWFGSHIAWGYLGWWLHEEQER